MQHSSADETVFATDRLSDLNKKNIDSKIESIEHREQ